MKGKEQLSFEIGEEKSKSDNKEEKCWKLEFYEEKNFKDTEIGPIPEDWEVVRLGEVAEVKQGKQLSSRENINGKYIKPFLRTSNILWNKIDLSNISFMYFSKEEFEALRLEKGDVLICEGGDVGRSAVWEGQLLECSYQNHIHRVRTYNNKLFNYFLSYFMELAIVYKGLFVNNANRTTIPNLSSSRLKQFLIPLPPLTEQKAIAEVLSTIQSAREKTEEVIKATRELKKSIMKHLFTYGPVPIDQIDKIKLKETEIGPIPEHWEVVRLGEVLDKKVSFISTNINHNEKIPFIPMSLIPVEKVYIEKWEYKSKEEIKSGILVFEGDLLLAKITPCFENGKQGIVINLPNKYAYATTEVIPIRVVSKVSNIFLAYYLSNKKIREILIPKMEGTTGRKRLPKSQLETLPIPLLPLSEQQKISEILQSIDEKIQKEEEKKKALDNLFKSMLSNLMSGKIRIKILEGD